MFWKVIILNEILVVPLSHCLAMSDLYLFLSSLPVLFFPVVSVHYSYEKKKKVKKTGGLVMSYCVN